MADTFVIKNIEKFNVFEFTTMVIYYLNRPEISSTALRRALLERMGSAVNEFNEQQLHVFI